MKRNILLVCFALLCLAQLYVPASMIRQHERTLTQGEPVKLRCRPVDPADPFRGRYVSLSFELGEARTAPRPADKPLPEQAWVMLETDEEGFARWGELREEQPESGVYVQTTVYPYWSTEGETVHVELPVDRFYMNEEIAPEAERVYFEQVRAEPGNCYVTARVLNGMIVLEQLYIEGVPAADYVREFIANPPPPLPEGESSSWEGEGEGMREGEGIVEGEGTTEGEGFADRAVVLWEGEGAP